MRKDNIAQSFLEYAVVIGIVVAVFLSVGVFYKRSLQGKYRQTGDVLGQGSQFTPP